MQDGNFAEAVKYAHQWLDSLEDPRPDDYRLLAIAYYQMEDWRKTLEYASLTIEKAKATGVEIKENWWNLLLAAHWALEQYPEALEVSKTLLISWPKKNYWLQLGGLYYSLDNEPGQLAAYWSAYDQGLLDSGFELLTMSTLLMLAEVPYQAAVILQAGLDNGLIEDEVKNFRLLAQAWQMAQEYHKAVEPMRNAVEGEEGLEEKGSLLMNLAQTYNILGEYNNCASTAREALRLGDPEREAQVYLLLGQCQFEQQKFDEAGDSFTRAARDRDQRKAATQWQSYRKVEVERIRNNEARLARTGT